MKRLFLPLFSFLLNLPVALAVATLIFPFPAAAAVTTADQGRPGNQGPWPVTTSSSSPVLVLPGSCTAISQTVCSVTTAALQVCPAAQLASRRYVMLCNSMENSAAQRIKIRVDGTQVVLGVGQVGLTLGPGDCAAWPISAAVVPSVRSNAAGGADLQAFQCSSP